MDNNPLVPCRNWQEKLAALHLNDLSPAEYANLKTHMAGCPGCAAAFADYLEVDSLIREAFAYDDNPSQLLEWFMQEDLAAKLPQLPTTRLYHNLPPRLDSFVGRQTELTSIMEGLNSFHPLLVIEGMAGFGKTTLALEAAHQCLHGSDPMLHPLFDAAVWISLSDHVPQKYWFDEILNTIARVLEHNTVTQLSHEEKLSRVNELLHANQTLMIIDNFDTVSDSDLLAWIQQIPEPSQVLVLSRKSLQLPQAWTLHLEGLKEDDVCTFIDDSVQKLALPAMESAEIDDLLRVTRGNPQAIAMALGNLTIGQLSLCQVLDEPDHTKDILEHLCTQSWLTLDSSAQQVLLALSFFTGSANKKALAAVAGIDDTPLEMKQLAKLSLIEACNNGGEIQTHYELHPLIRPFIVSKLEEDPEWEQKARVRWIQWWLAFTLQCGDPDEMEWIKKYPLIEEERYNLVLVCRWCVDHKQYQELQNFWGSERLLWVANVYGCWQERFSFLRHIYEAAEKREDKGTAIEVMVKQGFTLMQMGRVEHAGELLNTAWDQKDHIRPEVRAVLAEDLVRWHMETNNFIGAQHWLKEVEQLVENFSESKRLRHEIIIQYYYGVMYMAEGKQAQAVECFNKTLKIASGIGWQHCPTYVQQFLADIIGARGMFHKAEDLLKTGLRTAEQNRDQRVMSYYQSSLAHLVLLQGMLSKRDEQDAFNKVKNLVQQAVDSFRRLGMQQEVRKLHRLIGYLSANPSLPSLYEAVLAASS